MILCPHCGKENLPQATRCVHCGEDLEELFRIEGMEDNSALQEEPDISVADLLESFRNDSSPKDEERRSADSTGQAYVSDSGAESNAEMPAEEEEQTPEWLARIRKRAQQEEDAAGELTRKGNSLDAARSEDHRGRVDEEFANWIGRIRENARRENLLMPKPAINSAASEEGVPEWLRKVRELQPEAEDGEQFAEEPAEEPAVEEVEPEEEQGEAAAQDQAQETETVVEQTSPEEILGDTEPAAEAVSELEPEPEAESAGEKAQPADEEDSDSGDAEELPESAAAPQFAPVLEELGLAADGAALELDEKPASSEELSADLLLLRRQKENAQILMNLIGEEGQGLPPAKTQRVSGRGWYRFILGAFLLVVLALVLVFVPEAKPKQLENPAPAVAIQDVLGRLEKGDKVLVVFEYQAATSAELEQIAAPVLSSLHTRGAELQFLTTHPNGLWLADALTRKAEIPARETAFLAGGRLGVLAAALKTDDKSTLVPAGIEELQNYELILLLEDSQADIQNWLEQAGPWLSASKLGVLASSQNTALLLPYYDAGQLAGFAAGTIEGRVLAQALDQAPLTSAPSRAFQAGLLVMIAVILLGILSKAEADSSARHAKEPEA